jgi:hypothetical protein
MRLQPPHLFVSLCISVQLLKILFNIRLRQDSLLLHTQQLHNKHLPYEQSDLK